MPDFKLGLFLFGCLGGVIPDLLRLVKNRDRLHSMSYFKHYEYWLSLIIFAALGGIIVYAFDVETVKEAIPMGFAAPEIISRLAANKVNLPAENSNSGAKNNNLAVDIRKITMGKATHTAAVKGKGHANVPMVSSGIRSWWAS